MRILIAAGYLGHYGEADGAVTTYRNLLPLFARSGLRVDIVAYGPEDRHEQRGDVHLYAHRPRVPVRIDSNRWVDLAFARSALARDLGRRPYALVQSSTPDPMGLWAQGLARRRGAPLVAIYHTALAEYAAIRARRAAGPFVSWLLGHGMEAWMRRYLNRADRILAPSECVRAEVARGVRPPVAVLGRGVDGAFFHPRRRRRAGGRVRALYVGRVTPEKNLELLIPIFARRQDIDLTIVGDGLSRETLLRSLPHATFTGRLEGEPLAQAYADADFFVFPSRTDTLGNVVLEAMASGLPVVVSDSMGPKELVRQAVTGFIAEDDAQFADAVETFVRQPEHRRRMGQNARAFAETRSWTSIFDQLLGHYLAALHKGAQGSAPSALVERAVC
jgi:phosphatidylinositol alpha 1,6-mannosyltransferase